MDRDPAGVAPPPQPPRAREGVVVQTEVHDRHQVELRFNYPVGEAGRWRYDVDAFFFVPRNVGLHAGNYPREQFYSDFTAYIRVDAAALALEDLADATNPASPLHRFAAVLEALRTAPRPPETRGVRVHVKLYANLFVTGMKREFRRLEKSLTRRVRAVESAAPRTSIPPGPLDVEGDLARDLDAALDRIRGALSAWRTLRSGYWPFERLTHHSLAEAMRTADEYMAVALEERIAEFAAFVQAQPRAHDGTGLVTRMLVRLTALAREEAALRLRYGYLSLSARSLTAQADPRMVRQAMSNAGEYFTYRASLLKKSVQNALYLNVRGSRQDVFVRNAASAAAAALAAIWALATQLPLALAGLPASTQFLLVSAAVLAYVTKDRIKALAGDFLLRRARTFDHAWWIYGEQLPELGARDFRARTSESVRFVSEAEVPDAVRAVRRERRTAQHTEVPPEEVIHYRKRLEVGTADGPRALPEGYRIRDILRVNVRHFLVRLDEPLDHVSYFDAETGGFRASEVPKVYHVNLVVRVRGEGPGESLPERYAHLRVVLNKDGIVRAEEIRARSRV